jgi:hypothetical protein
MSLHHTWTLGLGPSVTITTGKRFTPFESGSDCALGGKSPLSRKHVKIDGRPGNRPSLDDPALARMRPRCCMLPPAALACDRELAADRTQNGQLQAK